MMMADKASKSRFTFHMQTPITIAHDAFYTLLSVLKDAGIYNPCWVLPEEPVQRRLLKRIITSVCGQSCISGNESLIIANQELSEDSVNHYAHICKEQMFDGMILCGDESTIRFGKLISFQFSELSQDKLTKGCPMVLVPFGELDGSEYVGSISSESHVFENPSLIPIHSIVDGRLSRLTTLKSIARSVCYALLRVYTALLEESHPFIMNFVEAASTHAHLALELIVDSGRHTEAWIDGTLAAAVVIHAGGTCAQNQKNNAIITFSERLAIPGIADRYQSAAALLPYVCMRIQRNYPDIYHYIKELFHGMDPIEFTHTWIALADSRGTDKVIQHLCGDMHDLLTHPRNVRDLQPILSLFPNRGGRK
jgi:hypothetical protein